MKDCIIFYELETDISFTIFKNGKPYSTSANGHEFGWEDGVIAEFTLSQKIEFLQKLQNHSKFKKAFKLKRWRGLSDHCPIIVEILTKEEKREMQRIADWCFKDDLNQDKPIENS